MELPAGNPPAPHAIALRNATLLARGRRVVFAADELKHVLETLERRQDEPNERRHAVPYMCDTCNARAMHIQYCVYQMHM